MFLSCTFVAGLERATDSITEAHVVAFENQSVKKFLRLLYRHMSVSQSGLLGPKAHARLQTTHPTLHRTKRGHT